MTDERMEAAEKWMRDRFRETFDGNRGSMIPTALTAHEAGQECGEHSRDEEIAAKDSEIAKLRGMVLDLYLWLNCSLDDELTDEGRAALCREIPSARWREIKSIVGQAADEEKR